MDGGAVASAAVGVAQQSHVLLAPLATTEGTEINVLIQLIMN